MRDPRRDDRRGAPCGTTGAASFLEGRILVFARADRRFPVEVGTDGPPALEPHATRLDRAERRHPLQEVAGIR